MNFKLQSSYQPRGDQPAAIEQLHRGLEAGDKHQVLLGVTGSGKTFTMAKIIEQANRPALVLAHNKTLAAQLYHEFKGFFPENAVEYFVSYYDYYQPEAYVPCGGHLHRKRSHHQRRAGQAAHERHAFALRAPRRHHRRLRLLHLRHRFAGSLLRHAGRCSKKASRPRAKPCCAVLWIFSTSARKTCAAARFACAATSSRFIRPTKTTPIASKCGATRSTPSGRFDPLTGEIRSGQEDLGRVTIYPKTHYVMPQEQRDRAIISIQEELDWWKKELEKQGKFVEAQRVVQRTMFDIEMMRTIGYCHGVENYSRHFSGRLPGEAPPTLLDYVPQDYLLFIDECTCHRAAGARHVSRRPVAQADPGGLRLPHAIGAGQPPADIRGI